MDMNADMLGMLATSKMGHDKDTVYIIVKEEERYVYVSDGKLKTIENPKKKNKKHIILSREIVVAFLLLSDTNKVLSGFSK